MQVFDLAKTAKHAKEGIPRLSKSVGHAMNPDAVLCPTNKASGGLLVLFLACLAVLARSTITLPATHKFSEDPKI
jgi:hypothetical protein